MAMINFMCILPQFYKFFFLKNKMLQEDSTMQMHRLITKRPKILCKEK